VTTFDSRVAASRLRHDTAHVVRQCSKHAMCCADHFDAGVSKLQLCNKLPICFHSIYQFFGLMCNFSLSTNDLSTPHVSAGSKLPAFVLAAEVQQLSGCSNVPGPDSTKLACNAVWDCPATTAVGSFCYAHCEQDHKDVSGGPDIDKWHAECTRGSSGVMWGESTGIPLACSLPGERPVT
jgi:hypothetical protein